MSEPNGHIEPPKLSELFRAVVVGLRHAHQLLRALVQDNHPGIVGHRDTTEVLTEGPKVAASLEVLARILEAEETP